MIQKIALTVGTLGAAAVLAFALGLTNFVFAPDATKQTADTQSAAQTADVSVVAVGTTSNNGAGAGAIQQTQTPTKKVVDKVYIAPTPAPQIVRVTPPGPNTQPVPAAQHPQPKAPSAMPAAPDNNGQASERWSRHAGHERGDN